MNARQKLALKGTCSKCGSEINLYTRYRSGKGREIENSGATNFIESMSYYDRHRADTDPL